MKRVIKKLIITFGLIIWLFNGLLCFELGKRYNAEPRQLQTKIQIQTRLVNAGYDIGPKGIDGDIGADTSKAWDLATYQLYADHSDYETGRPK